MTFQSICGAFNLGRDEHRMLAPIFVGDLISRHDAFVRDHLRPHLTRYGSMPYVVLENDHHDHRAAVFDLFLASYGDAAADQSLLALEWAAHELCETPRERDGGGDDSHIALARLLPIAGSFGGSSDQAPHELARDWLNDQASYFIDYLAHVTLAEHSDVVRKLQDMSADFTLEPGRNHVRIVVSDTQAADTIKALFW